MSINRPVSRIFRTSFDSVIISRPSRHTFFVSQIPHHRSISTVARNSTKNNKTFIHPTTHRAILSTGLPPRPKQQNRHFTMSSKLVPSNPAEVAVIRDITPNVVTVSVPFARFGILRVGGRGTIIRLTSGTLAVFSPVALTPEVQAKVSSLGGNVGYLIAGDIEHHIFLSEWAAAYPGAKLLGPKGLQEKRAAVQNDPRIGSEEFTFVWDESNQHSNAVSPEFAADFEVEYVPAHPNKEIALFYKPDRVLIEADMLFNLPAIEQYSRVPAAQKAAHGLLNRVFEAVNSTAGEAKGLKRFLWYAISNGAKDRAGFNESVRRIDAWDFDTIVPCHGETVVGGGKALWRKAFEWHLQGHK
ncbi:hypothetical protein F4677DRAFT_355594 [Hypoxylon crocopeplum]|nr:hypothetical protein F4677DRAFT_355594 [Hypoxylon crocopeplum]